MTKVPLLPQVLFLPFLFMVGFLQAQEPKFTLSEWNIGGLIHLADRHYIKDKDFIRRASGSGIGGFLEAIHTTKQQLGLGLKGEVSLLMDNTEVDAMPFGLVTSLGSVIRKSIGAKKVRPHVCMGINITNILPADRNFLFSYELGIGLDIGRLRIAASHHQVLAKNLTVWQEDHFEQTFFDLRMINLKLSLNLAHLIRGFFYDK